MRPFHAIQGETLPNCYKNSSNPEKYAATKEQSGKERKTKEFTESNTRKRPIPGGKYPERRSRHRASRLSHVP